MKFDESNEIFDSDFPHRLTLMGQGPAGNARHVAITGKRGSRFAYRVFEWGAE